MKIGNYMGADVDVNMTLELRTGWLRNISPFVSRELNRALSILVERPFVKIPIVPPVLIIGKGHEKNTIQHAEGRIERIEIKLYYKEI